MTNILFQYASAVIENPKDPFTDTKTHSALFTMQNIYPADSLCIADLAKVDLRGF